MKSCAAYPHFCVTVTVDYSNRNSSKKFRGDDGTGGKRRVDEAEERDIISF